MKHDDVDQSASAPFLEEDYRRNVTSDVRSRFLPGTSIEVVHEVGPGVAFRHVLFDFDGTLSLIREGWPAVMVSMMTEEILATGTKESPEDISRHCHEFVMRLNGKQTIYQMIGLAGEIRERGGQPQDPLFYKEEYHDRLMEKIRHRREALRTGGARAGDHPLARRPRARAGPRCPPPPRPAGPPPGRRPGRYAQPRRSRRRRPPRPWT